jgi:hypothetical protein
MAQETEEQLQEEIALLKEIEALKGSLENPYEADLFNSASKRIKSSFGDFEGTKELLKPLGYKDIRKNKKGELVAANKEGKYFKDKDTTLNYLESNVGQALPMAGMVLGGAYGNIPGAALGGGTGEALRLGIGKNLGAYKGGTLDMAGDIAGETAMSALAETGGKLLGKVPLPGSKFSGAKNIDELLRVMGTNAVDYAKKGQAAFSQMASGVAKEAHNKMLNRPLQVRNALNEGNALRVATKGATEREERAALENRLISQAREAFQNNFGGTPVDTSKMLDVIKRGYSRNRPNQHGQSALTKAEAEELKELVKSLVSPSTIPTVPGAQAQFSFPLQLPKQTAGSLQKTADFLQQNISDSYYNRTIQPRGDKSIGIYKELLGKIKEALHKVDPQGLGRADKRFSEYITQSKLLGNLDNEMRAESFVANMLGKNKGAVGEAARKIIPDTFKDIEDIAAAKAFGVDNRLKAWTGASPSGPAMARMASPFFGGFMGYSASHGDPKAALFGGLAGAAFSVGTAPITHETWNYLVGRYGLPVLTKIARNPQLIPFLIHTRDQGLFKTILNSPWSSVQQPQQGE